MKATSVRWLSRYFTDSRKDVLRMLQDPQLWSEDIAKETLERMKGSPFNIQDVEQILQEYCGVLSEHVMNEKSK